MRSTPAALALGLLLSALAISQTSAQTTVQTTGQTTGQATGQAQVDPHPHHRTTAPAAAAGAAPTSAPPASTPVDPNSHNHAGHHHTDHDHAGHDHAVGPAGRTYDLRWIDAMVQHHTGALRMSERVFGIGAPAVGALAREIWRDQAQEIKAMGQWRKAWYPGAPVYPVALKPAGDPNAMADLIRMSPAQIEAMRMSGSIPADNGRVTWFLEQMLEHHGGALIMAHDALRKSSHPTIRRLARAIIVAQRQEIIQLRRMLGHDGLSKPQYYQYDTLFLLP